MELFIARHGETQSSIENRILGSGGDSPLTKKGVEQAKILGKSFENIAFDAVYTSPLGRAINTLNIALTNKYKPIVDERLTGLGLGIIEGMTWDEAFAAYPDASTFMSDPAAYIPPPNGEKLVDTIKRVDYFLEDIAKMQYSKVFVLTHGYVLRVLYACVIDKSVSGIGTAPIYSNCEVVHYTYNHNWKLV